MKTFTMLGTLLVMLTLASPVLAWTRYVNCNRRDETITEALTRAKPGDTIRVRGTCKETVVITTDRLTLEGRGNAVLDGQGVDVGSLFALLTVDGAQGVVFTGQFTVQNSVGIGMLVHSNAQAVFRGNVVIQDNASHGLLVFNGGSARFAEGSVEVTDNGGDGVVVANGANAIVDLTAGAFTITSDRNAHGFHLSNGGSFQVLGGTLNAAENRVHGIRVAYGANLFMTALAPDPTVTITDNTTAGVSVQAGFIDLRMAKITDNGPMDAGLDVDLGFGTRAHLTGNAIGRLRCDKTVLLSPDTDVRC